MASEVKYTEAANATAGEAPDAFQFKVNSEIGYACCGCIYYSPIPLTHTPTVSITNGVLAYNSNVVLTEYPYALKGAQAMRIPLSKIRLLQQDSDHGVGIVVDDSTRVHHIYHLASPAAFVKRVSAEIDKVAAIKETHSATTEMQR